MRLTDRSRPGRLRVKMAEYPETEFQSKRVYFISLGCPKNRVDSEVMLGQMGQAGHSLVDSPEQADVIVVNTCGFIDAAKEESIDTILEMAQFKSTGQCEKLVVTGCLTQRYPDDVAREIPEIDSILGSADFSELSQILGGPVVPPVQTLARKGLPVIKVSDTPAYLYDHTSPRVLTGNPVSAYVKIAEGCDRPCAFCIIPKLRGPQRSRSIESVVQEVTQLAANGTREFNLVAQDLTRYGTDLAERPNLAQLLKAIAPIPGVHWMRLHYTYPSAFTDELIAVIASHPTIAKYIDVPLQHIADSMLRRMRRGHSSKVSYSLVDRLRQNIPGVVLRTTFIVGHPGETDEDFADLCKFVEFGQFDRVGVFTYSPEPGTHSAELGDVVPAKVAKARQRELMQLQKNISKKKNRALIGQTLEVLVEGVSSESEYLLQGRWFGQAPEIDGHVILTDGLAKPGDFVRAKVTQASDYDIVASLEQAELAA